MYTFLLALIYLAFISLGLPDSLLGAGWPVMYAELGVPISFMGIISMIISGCTIISSMLSDRMTRKFGTRGVTVASVFLTAFSLIGFSMSDRFFVLAILSVPYGLGAGTIDAALNNYVALHYSSRHMSWLHCFWGVGAVISPFVMSHALVHSNWNAGYRTVGFIQLGIAAVLTVTLPVWKKAGTRSVPVKQKALGLSGALKIRGVPFLLLGFFAYCAAEATGMYWASTYLVRVTGLGEETAAGFGSLIYIGLTVGRFIAGFFSNRLGDRRMIIIGASAMAAGILTMLIPGSTAAVAGLTVTGFGCAPIYPSIIHSTPSNFGPENSGAIIGIQMASAYMGSTFMPPLFGVLGSGITFSILPLFLAFFTVLTVTMTELTFRITSKSRSIPAANKG